MLIMGQTPNQHKAFLWECITSNRELIKTLETNLERYPDLRTDTNASLNILRTQIRESLQELVTLERWRRKHELEPDQPYKPPSLLQYEKELEENGETDDYIEYKATIQQEIDRLEYERSTNDPR